MKNFKHQAILEAYIQQDRPDASKMVTKPILSGGSTKRIVRIITENLEPYIVLEMPWVSDYGCGLDYFRVGEFITQLGGNVPTTFSVNAEHGIILTQDLGDIRLLDALSSAKDDKAVLDLYKSVVSLLVQMQLNFSSNTSGFTSICIRVYDKEKFYKEISIFYEYFFQKHLKTVTDYNNQQRIYTEMQKVLDVIVNSDQSLVLKDVHSRNIMIHNAAPYFIDYQDCVLGPEHYDFASLIYDQFYFLEETIRQQLIEFYLNEKGIDNVDDRQHARRGIDYLALHRCLKGIGSYASFEQRRNETRFLRFIGVFWNYMLGICRKYTELTTLARELQALYHSK